RRHALRLPRVDADAGRAGARTGGLALHRDHQHLRLVTGGLRLQGRAGAPPGGRRRPAAGLARARPTAQAPDVPRRVAGVPRLAGARFAEPAAAARAGARRRFGQGAGVRRHRRVRGERAAGGRCAPGRTARTFVTIAVEDVAERIVAGVPAAIARGISWCESGGDQAAQLLDRLPARGAHVVGVTGSPGAGKSTLVNRLVRDYRAQGATVAVV